MAKRTHIVIPDQLAQEIDAAVGKRGRSSFLVAAAVRELSRIRQLQVIERVAGSWKDKDHPELKDGAANWVARQRQLDEHRLKKATR